MGDAARPRRRARRHVVGRGRFTADLIEPALGQACFVRSPFAHAVIEAIDVAAASRSPGCIAVLTGADVARVCKPFQGLHRAFADLAAPFQNALAVEVARWQGEPVALVVAEDRAAAEDAAELIDIDWREKTPVVDADAALAPQAPVIHDDLASNLALELTLAAGDAETDFADAAVVVEDTFVFARQTGVPLEPRSIIAAFDPSERRLTVHQSHQTPFDLQHIYAQLLDLPEHRVRVVCPDVGGGFGIKQQLYGDEVAVCAAAMILGRPVKFVADRLESFVSDIHAREHRIAARMALDGDGRITAFDVDDLFGIGAYSQYPRSSIGEGSLVLRFVGAAYGFRSYRARLRVAYQNKPLIGHYRGVGQPIACAVTEALVDKAAHRLRLDPIEIRRRNLVRAGDQPESSPTGLSLPPTALDACLDMLADHFDIDALRRSHDRLRESGIHRGVGLALLVDLSVPGSEYYGRGAVDVTSQDGSIVRLEPSGVVRCVSSVTDQGQGTADGIAQIVSEALGVAIDDVDVVFGDTEACPYGGGAWASRGLAIAGEAAHLATLALKRNILNAAGSLLQCAPDALDIRDGWIVDVGSGRRRQSLRELARISYFQQFLLPDGQQPQLMAAHQYLPPSQAQFGCGVQLSEAEVDVETGMIKLLRHVAVVEGGKILNPLVADEQIRGGIVQGIGSALYEECRYDDTGQLQNGSLADYLVPMAAEMPDIEVHHVPALPTGTHLGVKGVGETGTVGAQAAVLNAVNDALRPFEARITRFPITPMVVLDALGKLPRGDTDRDH